MKRQKNQKMSQSRSVMIPLMNRGVGSQQLQIAQYNKRISKPTPQKLHKLKDPSYVVKIRAQSWLQKKCNYLDSKFLTFSPDSRYFLIWNIILAIAILFNFYQIPVSLFLTKLVYEDQFENYAVFVVINIIFLVVFLIDMIIVRPNLSFYQHGQLIRNRYKIMKRYLKFQVYIDLISFIILLSYISAGYRDLIYLKIFFYVKAYSLYNVDSSLFNYLELYKILNSIYVFFRIGTIIGFIIIWMASVYFAIDYHYYLQQGTYFNNNNLWLTDTFGGVDLIQDVYWPYWLAYAVYTSSQISATIGYGIGTPRNPDQVIFISVMMIIMTVVFALFINTIWDIIGDIEESGVDYQRNWASLNKILKQKEISHELKLRVSDYFHQVWKYNDKKTSGKINQQLSKNLKLEIKTLSHLHIFHGIPLFQRWQRQYPQLWNQLKILLFDVIQNFEVAENQTLICEQNEKHTFYCILQGRMKLKINSKNTDINQFQVLYKVNQRFGYEQFFMQKLKTYTAKADCFTRLTKIQLCKFIECLKKIPFFHFSYIRQIQKLKLTDGRQVLDQDCWFCSGKHTPFKCPKKTNWRFSLLRKDPISYKYMSIKQRMDKTELQGKKIYRNLIKSQKVKNKILNSSHQVDRIQTLNNDAQIQTMKGKQKQKFNFQ